MTPRVTITIPCYGAGSTLGMALASVVAQTVDDWECVIVDDGSTPPVAPIVERFEDSRFRLHRFDDNRGRPVARQQAIDMARGDYVCMLDADDWYYPEKLERQLALLDDEPTLAAVSTAVAVVDDEDRLVGVRSLADSGLEVRVGDRNRPPKVVFPSMMFRRQVVEQGTFDPRLRRAEDPDFLMKILGGRRYGVTDEISYAYRETYSPKAVDEALLALRCQRITFRERFGDAPVESGWQYLGSLARTGIYRVARAVGRGEWLFDRRNREASAGERRRFVDRRRAVLQVMEQYDL